MQSSEFKVKVFGTRGSMAIDGEDYSVFGGATSCYLVQAGEENIFLDAGSGLIKAPVEFTKTPLILLSHLHLDHLLGLGVYPRLLKRGTMTKIFVPVREGEDAKKTIGSIYAPPFWPVSFLDYAGDMEFQKLQFPIRAGEVLIEGIEGNHPGGCAIIKLSFRDRSLVYVSDYEHEEASFQKLTEFAKGTELLLYDGQYTKEEYPGKKGFGHSTPEKGIDLMEKCGAKRLLFIHHDPLSTDGVLLKREAELNREQVRYARQGEEILL